MTDLQDCVIDRALGEGRVMTTEKSDALIERAKFLRFGQTLNEYIVHILNMPDVWIGKKLRVILGETISDLQKNLH